MIALCPEHHRKADAGAYTKAQLREFKNNAIAHSKDIIGRFDWLRNDLLVVIGGFFYYKKPQDHPLALTIQDQPVVWFNRDEDYLLLNLKMYTTSNEERACIKDNYWIAKGCPTDLESPPSGKLLCLKYSNGDYLRVEYGELNSLKEAAKRYPHATPHKWEVNLPITVVEIYFRVGGTSFDFRPTQTIIPQGKIRNVFFSGKGSRGFSVSDRGMSFT